MDSVHLGDSSNRNLQGPKHGHSMISGLLAGVNLLLLPFPFFWVFPLKKEGVEAIDSVHPGDSSNRNLLGPKHGHFIVSGLLAGVNLLLLPFPFFYVSPSKRKLLFLLILFIC